MKILVPVLAVLLGLLFVAGMFYQSAQDRPSPAAITSPTAPAPPASTAPADEEATPAPAPDEAQPQAQPTAHTQKAEQTKPAAITLDSPLRVQPAANPHAVTLGSADRATGYKLQLSLVSWGAGVQQILLTDFQTDGSLFEPNKDFPYILETSLTTDPAKVGQAFTIYPYAARSIQVNGQAVSLANVPWQPGDIVKTDQAQSVDLRLTLVDADDQPMLDIVRTYRVTKGGYDIALSQRFINRTSGPLEVVWNQYIQGDVVDDGAQYLGDQRLFAMGYFPPRYPGRPLIFSEDSFVNRRTLVDADVNQHDKGQVPQGVWPNPSLSAGSQWVWLAAENRYFALVTHPPITDAMTRTADIPPLEETFPYLGTEVFPLDGYYNGVWVKPEDRRVAFTLTTGAITLEPQTPTELNLGIYAGPREKTIFKHRPYALLNLGNLIRYELGCSWFTFQWLARFLLNFLTFLHNYVTFDWGLAIIALVACVRLCLHPITKRAQVNMMKMGRQMAALQPETEKLKKKYKDDQAKLNTEMMKLYREKGINPANMLGCLPMFLQMPIWVALYAMLYFAIELRHQPAFFGLFQWISGGHWHFLQSLSSPDNFLRLFDSPITIPLIFIELNFQSINLLPLLMGVVFFFQQKFTTPPPQNEQAAQQQKIMKFMILLFPIFLYSAPSGLTLYILASTTAGVAESYIVRKHIKEQEAAGTLFDKKPIKPGGFRDRLGKAMEAKQQQLQAQMQNKDKAKKKRS